MNYITRSLAFSLGVTIIIGFIVPGLSSSLLAMVRSMIIQAGAFMVGIALFYERDKK